MENWRKLIREKKGFTIVEMIVVITMIAVITAVSVPAFMSSLRRSYFETTVANVVSLLNRARTQALASEMERRADGTYQIPPGGYGVFLDSAPAAQLAVLFVDDWNNSVGAKVNVNYGDDDIANRILPDGIYTAGGDSALETIVINSREYIKLSTLSGDRLSDASDWSPADGAITIIFEPPYAETTILGNSTTSLQNFTAVFDLLTDQQTRTIKFNRVTTAAQVFKN